MIENRADTKVHRGCALIKYYQFLYIDEQVEIEKFHKNNDLYTKYEKFSELILESPELEDTVW